MNKLTYGITFLVVFTLALTFSLKMDEVPNSVTEFDINEDGFSLIAKNQNSKIAGDQRYVAFAKYNIWKGHTLCTENVKLVPMPASKAPKSVKPFEIYKSCLWTKESIAKGTPILPELTSGKHRRHHVGLAGGYKVVAIRICREELSFVDLNELVHKRVDVIATDENGWRIAAHNVRVFSVRSNESDESDNRAIIGVIVTEEDGDAIYEAQRNGEITSLNQIESNP